MSKKIQAGIALLILVAGVIWSFTNTRPQVDLSEEIPANQFSTARAFEHVQALAQEPHYVGSSAHSLARNYIVDQLEELGLLVEMQEGFPLTSMEPWFVHKISLPALKAGETAKPCCSCRTMTVPCIPRPEPATLPVA